VDDDTVEFYKLVACLDLEKLDDELVSRYIRCMRQQFQGNLNFFDPSYVCKGHQSALDLEKTLSRRPFGLVGGSNGGDNCPNPSPLTRVAAPPPM
jgi:hypothetical protein